MKVTLKQLEVLRAVVLSGAISNARKSLGLSQPTISQQLAKMEEVLRTQLIHRGRSNGITMTQAGEYWFRIAEDVLGRIDVAEAHHQAKFSDNQLDLRFGTTPSLRGQFLEKAASISLENSSFSRFEFVWAQTSDEVVQMINAHRINCGVVSAASVEQYKSSLHICHLFEDEIVWVVPKTIPDDMIERAMQAKTAVPKPHEALNRYVDVRPGIPWHDRSENWYRSQLPFAWPYFSCMTHQAAVDFVAGGMATCHCPSSLIPNLSEQVRNRIRMFRMHEHVREAVLVMPKHLLTLRPFAAFEAQLTSFIRQSYSPSEALAGVEPFPGQASLAAQ